MSRLRDAVASDLDELVRLNAASVPAVSAADREAMTRLVDMAALAWVLDSEPDGGLDGFVLLMEPGAEYPSANYGWFAERFERFLYVDRVVVDEAVRGAGLGASIYAAVIEEAERRGSVRVTAEVNVTPPNPGSSRFHRRMGFESIGIVEHAPDYVTEMLAHVL